MSNPTNPEPATLPKRTRTARAQATKKTAAALPRPADDDHEGWKKYWSLQGQPWRTESEIDEERQKFLKERLLITPDIEKGIYPFKAIKLSRADVEWLLATHDNGLGPVDWTDAKQRHRKGVDLRGADSQEVDLRQLPLARVRGGLTKEEWFDTTSKQREVSGIHLEWANMYRAHLEGAIFHEAHLEWVFLRQAFLKQADLSEAHLTGINLREAHMEAANINLAHLEHAKLRSAHLAGANLQLALFDVTTDLRDLSLTDQEHGGAAVSDVLWNGVNLSVVHWESVAQLGDEQRARKSRALAEYQTAVRANRQLAVVLREQGLNEVADHFAYRAQLLQRVVLRQQRKPLKYLGSWLLWLIAGYGYRPLRSLVIYLLLIFGFAMAYFFLGPLVGVPLSPLGAIVFSVTSFHGRGFFPGGSITLDDPLTVGAAAEAVVGLLIEISFIATFTQRFFGR